MPSWCQHLRRGTVVTVVMLHAVCLFDIKYYPAIYTSTVLFYYTCNNNNNKYYYYIEICPIIVLKCILIKHWSLEVS